MFIQLPDEQCEEARTACTKGRYSTNAYRPKCLRPFSWETIRCINDIDFAIRGARRTNAAIVMMSVWSLSCQT